MSGRLGEIVTSICRGNGDVDSFEAFMMDFVDCSDFLDYFKAIWCPRIGTWTSALKALPLASTEVSVSVECYHTQLKSRVLNEEDLSIYQRTDWLVDKLGTKVHSYYWLDEYAGKENFARYWKDEWKSGLSSWQLSLHIPETKVIEDGKCAKVVDGKDLLHIVLNPGLEFAMCDCDWSRMGNLRKHVIKSTKVYRDRGLVRASTSLFEYNRILMNILNCPPNDSVIHDHAIALAASVHSQLSLLFGDDLHNDGLSALENHDEILGDGSNSIAEDIEQQLLNNDDILSNRVENEADLNLNVCNESQDYKPMDADENGP